jgi:hypothetical protein
MHDHGSGKSVPPKRSLIDAPFGVAQTVSG